MFGRYMNDGPQILPQQSSHPWGGRQLAWGVWYLKEALTELGGFSTSDSLGSPSFGLPSARLWQLQFPACSQGSLPSRCCAPKATKRR